MDLARDGSGTSRVYAGRVGEGVETGLASFMLIYSCDLDRR